MQTTERFVDVDGRMAREKEWEQIELVETQRTENIWQESSI